MSSWPTDEDESDLLDPTAALAGNPQDAEQDTVEEDAEAGGDPIADESASVKVWIDEHGKVVKVLLSNRWRERSKDPLTDRFLEALRRAQGAEPEPRPLPTSNLPGREPGAEVPLDAVMRRLFELRAKRRELKSRPVGEVRRSTWTGTPGRGRSADHKVEVSLRPDRSTHTLTIDDAWAATARAEQIGSAVLQAHQAAYAAHVPGEHTRGEFGELAAEASALANELMPRINR